MYDVISPVVDSKIIYSNKFDLLNICSAYPTGTYASFPFLSFLYEYSTGLIYKVPCKLRVSILKFLKGVFGSAGMITGNQCQCIVLLWIWFNRFFQKVEQSISWQLCEIIYESNLARAEKKLSRNHSLPI